MSVSDMNKELEKKRKHCKWIDFDGDIRFYWTICAHPTIRHSAHFGACYYNDCVREECPLWDKGQEIVVKETKRGQGE